MPHGKAWSKAWDNITVINFEIQFNSFHHENKGHKVTNIKRQNT